MKKYFASIFYALLFAIVLPAQSLGVSAYALGFFALVAQYSFLYGLNGVYGQFGLLDTTIRNQVSVGVFYPLIKS